MEWTAKKWDGEGTLSNLPDNYDASDAFMQPVLQATCTSNPQKPSRWKHTVDLLHVGSGLEAVAGAAQEANWGASRGAPRQLLDSDSVRYGAGPDVAAVCSLELKGQGARQLQAAATWESRRTRSPVRAAMEREGEQPSLTVAMG